MSSEEGAVAAEPAASIPGEPMDIMTAVQLVLRKSRAYGGLARGLHESAKAIEKHASQLCVLAEDCDRPDYVKLVKALCAEHNVSLLTVPSAKTLGEWAGLCKIDSEGKARKVLRMGKGKGYFRVIATPDKRDKILRKLGFNIPPLPFVINVYL